LEHLLTDCQRWKDRREQRVGAVLSTVAGTGAGSKEEKTVLLQGGEHSGNRVSRWLPRSTDSETITCGALQVARFWRFTRANEPKPSRV